MTGVRVLADRDELGRMAIALPGRFAGGRGTLRPGEPADLVRFTWSPGDETLSLVEVVRGGQVVGWT